MSTALRKKVLLAVFLPLPLLLIVGALLVWQVARLKEAAFWVDHTDKVLAQAEQSYRYLLDQETGLRGFLVTRDALFLEPYTSGQQEFPRSVDRLKQLTADNAAQGARIEDLRRRYQAWLSEAKQTLRSSPSGANPSLAASLRDRKQDMDQMRAVFAQISGEEERLLVARKKASDANFHLAILSSLIALPVLAVFLVWYVRTLVNAVDHSHQRALDDLRTSEGKERRARAAAEALAAEVSERSIEMERLYAEVRQQRDLAQQRLASFESRR